MALSKARVKNPTFFQLASCLNIYVSTVNAEELSAALVNIQLQDTTKSRTRDAKIMAEIEGTAMEWGDTRIAKLEASHTDHPVSSHSERHERHSLASHSYQA